MKEDHDDDRRHEGGDKGGLVIISYNVHGWVDTHRKTNVSRVIKALRPHHPDIVGLCEVGCSCRDP